jgi:soluble lytic murein transglycosylase-like protein
MYSIPYIISLVCFYAPFYQVPPSEALAIIDTESAFNPWATGSAGEVGLFQIHPKWHKEYEASELYDPHKNVLIGLLKIKKFKRLCGSKWPTCYNRGVNGMKKMLNASVDKYAKLVRERKDKKWQSFSCSSLLASRYLQ